MTRASKINKHNLRQLAWAKGYRGISGLAVAIGKSRVTIHRAVNRPGTFGPTIKQLENILL